MTFGHVLGTERYQDSMFDYHRTPRFDSDQGKCSGAGDENRTRMTSLEGRDHCACRRAPSSPRVLMTDLGLPTLAVLNGPLMAQAWFHCEPMTCKPSTSRRALRAISRIFLSRPGGSTESLIAAYTFAALARSHRCSAQSLGRQSSCMDCWKLPRASY